MPALILLVDDNIGDVRLTREALQDADASITLLVATDGVDAMGILGHEARRPDLILLDLNLPRMGGLDLLARVKGDESLKTIPVVVLTTSEAPNDVAESYRLGANAYLTKPVQFEAFVGVVKSIIDFWLNRAQLPTPS